MVKMSVDFPSEAPRCQRISSETPQISFDPDEIADAIAGLFSVAALWDKIISAATGRSTPMQLYLVPHAGNSELQLVTRLHDASSKRFQSAIGSPKAARKEPQ
jgi:hypothetical protein